MTIRAAKFGDIPRLTELIQEMHARSCYADRATLDVKATKALFMSSIQRHGSRHQGGALVNVAETRGVVEGFLLGLLDRCYHVLHQLMATDLFFYVSQRGDPGHARLLLTAFIEWAEANPNVIEIRMGATSAIGDYERTAALYRRAGLVQAGGIYEREVEPCLAS